MTTLKLKFPEFEVKYEGTERFLETKVPQLLEKLKKSHNAEVKRKLLELNEGLQQNLSDLDGHVADLSQLNGGLASRIKELNDKLLDFFESIATFASSSEGSADLLAATKEMQETQMSFNLQYLQLQRQMQNENRSYTAVSNIMKTKHDTVKNSISNIR
jgi:Ulp1 family protease